VPSLGPGVRRLNAHIQTGHYHDTDEVLEKAP
jgi:hypothetical protein